MPRKVIPACACCKRTQSEIAAAAIEQGRISPAQLILCGAGRFLCSICVLEAVDALEGNVGRYALPLAAVAERMEGDRVAVMAEPRRARFWWVDAG